MNKDQSMDAENAPLEKLVLQWCKTNFPHRGKWSLIGKIATDLGLPTFPHNERHWYEPYDWNNDVARAINKFLEEGIIDVRGSGNAYLYYLKEEEK